MVYLSSFASWPHFKSVNTLETFDCDDASTKLK